MSNQLTNLQMEEIVKRETDFLIGLVDEIEENLKGILGSRRSNDSFGNSQIRNLLQAAKSASGVKEIILFIQYQMGREAASYDKKWLYKIKDVTLGDAVIQRLRVIDKKVSEIVDSKNENHRKLLIKMIERFFLYLSWKYRYLAVESEENANQSGKNQYQQKRRQQR